MRPALILCLFLALAGPSPAQSLPKAPEKVFAPKLLPGEGLAVATTDGDVKVYGEARKEAPMGSLAKLVWLRLEGDDWAAAGVTYRCTGHMGPYTCWLPEGHGKVDLAKATQVSCNLAFLAWAMMSEERWKRQYGEGAARARLEDGFFPFLANRLPPGDELPELTPAWIGDGDLLRTSPEAMAQWMVDPAQDALLTRCRRLLLGFFEGEFSSSSWWMKTGTAPVPSDPLSTSAWVVGSDGKVVAVLHLPSGRGKAEGLTRFRELMGIPGK